MSVREVLGVPPQRLTPIRVARAWMGVVMIGAVMPLAVMLAHPSAAAALPIVPQAGTDAYYGTSLPYPSGATGLTTETFTTTVASQPTWQTDKYFFANQTGFSGAPPAAALDKKISTSSTTAPSVTIAPAVFGDLLVAFVSSPTIPSNLSVTGNATGQGALAFTRLSLPNNPSSLAIFTARDSYTTNPSVVVNVANSQQGPVTALTVEAFKWAYDVAAITTNSSAGGGALGAPSVTVNTVDGYPGHVVGVAYDPTTASAVTKAAGDVIDSKFTDIPNHAVMWVQSQTAAVIANGGTTLSDTVHAGDAWQYAAVEIRAQGAGMYIGIMPNYNNDARALFSFFGSGATNLASTCEYGADGGPGVKCTLPITFVVGHQYQTQVTAVVGTSLATFTGTVKDLTANGATSTIGSWKLPKSIGVIKGDPAGWTEWFAGGTDCTSLPYARVINGAPTGIGNDTSHTAVTGTINSIGNPWNKCASAEKLSNTVEMSTTGQPRVDPDVTGATTSAAASASVTLTPQAPDDFIVASISTYTGSSVTVSGGGLAWTKSFEARDGITNDGGLISVWTARASSTFPAPTITVTSAITGNAGWAQTLSVTGYIGAAGIGATQFNHGPNTSTPTLTMTPDATGSWISTAGFDPDNVANVTAGSGEVIDTSWPDNVLNSEMWFQHSAATSTASQPVTITDTLSPIGAWDLGTVEILAAPRINLVARAQSATSSSSPVTATVQALQGAGNLTGGDLLVAYVSTVNSATVSVTTPGDPGIVWTNKLNQADGIPNDGGLISVWAAEVPLDFGRTSITAQSTVSGNAGWAQTMVLEQFNGAADVGAVAFANGTTASSPSVSITPQKTGSWIAGVGFDADSPATVVPGANQVVSATAQDNVLNSEMWFQYSRAGSSASKVVTLNDTLSPVGAWDLAAVEIMPQT